MKRKLPSIKANLTFLPATFIQIRIITEERDGVGIRVLQVFYTIL